ncbi:TetR/AcrR family transcriptional regulator [Mucilaginibacter sp.]|jgi:AcrR family transcriptional regulator|uniref:TetR/AcrR family transcriptional regulator n=1 Tax=Mucilaginibacter sp. TaxID=1882438 RepID=UPI003561A306
MKKAEKTKQFIIEQAAPIYNEKGIAGTTIDEVLEAANVARGCLYNHFVNKDALSYATADYLLKKNDDVVSSAVNKGKTAKEKIHAYLNFSINPLETHITGGCPIFNLAAEADDNNPIVKEKVKKSILAAHRFFTSILKEGIKNGEFIETFDVNAFAYKLFASVEGTILICRVLGTNQPMQSVIKSLKLELQSYEINNSTQRQTVK